MNFPTALKHLPAPIPTSWQGCLANVFRAVFILGLSSFLFPFSAFQFPISDLEAAPVAYSGKIAVNGENFDGPGHFRFKLVDHNGSVLWSNAPDGAAVTTAVNRGHYSVLLGDDTTPHMAAIPENLFLDHPVIFLRVHFSQGDGQPFVHLHPDQRILSAAHALTAEQARLAFVAEKVKAGAITLDMLSAEVLANLNASIANGSITTDMLSPAVLAELHLGQDDRRFASFNGSGRTWPTGSRTNFPSYHGRTSCLRPAHGLTEYPWSPIQPFSAPGNA